MKSTSSILFWVTFITYAFFYQGGGMNEAARFDTIRSVLEYGSLEITPFAYNSADIIQYEGRIYSGKAPGTFYMGYVPFALTYKILNLTPISRELRDHLSCYVATVLTISLCGALLVVLIYWMGLRLKRPEAESAAVALCLGFGTILFPFATVFFSHVAAATCLFAGFYQVYAFHQDGARERWRLWLAGAVLGFSVTLEYPSAIGAGLIGLYAIHRSGPKAIRELAPFVLGGIGGVLPLLAYNVLAFGKPFYMTYEAYAAADNTSFEAHKQGFFGIRLPFTDPSAWAQFKHNLQQITYKPLRGLFFANPVLALIFAAYVKRPKNLESALALFILAGYFTLNASFGDSITYWGGGASFGPRYLISALPFLALPLFIAIEGRALRLSFIVLGLLSVGICLMATSIEPRAPYAPQNPIFYYYLPRFMAGLLSSNPIGIFSNVPITDTGVSFNWGQLIGLPLSMQLFPLYALWMGGAYALDQRLGQAPSRGFTFATATLVTILAWLSVGANA